MSVRIRRSTLMAASAGALLFSCAAAASAATTALPAAYINGGVDACASTMCGGAADQSANADNGPLSTFGDDYDITSFIPDLQNPHAHTPGEIIVGEDGNSMSLAANGSPKFTVSALGVGGAAGSLNYFFRVVKLSAPTTETSVDIGVTAAAHFSGSTYDPYAADGDDLNDGTEQVQLLIPGTTVNALSVAVVDYYSLNGIVLNDYTTGTTSNATAMAGPVSTFSGGFNLKDVPVSIVTDTIYQVEMSASLEGGYAFGATSATLDPMFNVPVGYQLELSPGVNNGVPEPAAWAMMLFGFFGIGDMIRGARRRPAMAG